MESYSLIKDECKRPAVTKTPNCARFDPSGKCVGCDGGYILMNYNCVTERCSSVSISGKCTACKGDYKLSADGNCVSLFNPERLKDVCSDISKDGTSCDRCKPGYLFDENGTCLEGDALCSKYSNELCSTCVDGAYIKNGACISSTEDYCSARAGGS